MSGRLPLTRKPFGSERSAQSNTNITTLTNFHHSASTAYGWRRYHQALNVSSLPLSCGGVLLLAMSLPAPAQFSQLAVTDDGKQVYFTSQLLLRDAPTTKLPPESRLYRLGPEGVTAYAERDPLRTPPYASGGGIILPQVTGDGTLTGFTVNWVCPAPSDCDVALEGVAKLQGSRNIELGPGTLQVSRNGRWGLLSSTAKESGFDGLSLPNRSVLIDLATNARTDLPGTPPSAYGPGDRILASDGTVLVQRYVAPSRPLTGASRINGLWKEGRFSPLEVDDPFALSDDAGTVIAGHPLIDKSGSCVTRRIVAFKVASKKLTELFQSKCTQAVEFMALSADGSRALYRVGDQHRLNGTAYIADTSTGQSLAIQLPAGELVVDGTLTGGGDFAFLATTAGRLVKVTLSTTAVEELIPPVPHCFTIPRIAYGSLARLRCAVTGPPGDLQGLVRLNNTAAHILFTNGQEIGVQIPWQIDDDFFSVTLAIDTPTRSPFRSGQNIDVRPMALAFEPDGGQGALLGLKLIKSDWTGLLTAQPKPGDILYAYMTGLGRVDGPMVTGVPASMTIPAPIFGTIRCWFGPGVLPAETVFAGLAPGTIGIYQVAFRLPEDAGPEPITGAVCSYEWGLGVVFGPQSAGH